MEKSGSHQPEVYRNIDECQRLAEAFFEDEQVGSYKRQAYVPLDFSAIGTASQSDIPHFLRITTSVENSSQSGALDVIQCFQNGEVDVHSGFITTDRGEFYQRESRYALPSAFRLAWPTVFQSPQVMNCLEVLKDPSREPEIEPGSLLDELVDVSDDENHIVQKMVEGIEVDGFSISIKYQKYAMPHDLAEKINIKKPFLKQYRFLIKRGGVISNDIHLNFARGQQLESYQDTVRPERKPDKTLADLAAFSRMVLN